MNITHKIIITDTNIITDLNNANILDKFVRLDNVYISDMVKNDEVNSNTGNVRTINNFKTVGATPEQIEEIFQISQRVKGLSQFDIINYIIARDNNAILATGDQKLKTFSENNGIEVIRTLKVIELMESFNIISKEEAINACNLLKTDKSTRIPKDDIDNLINEFEKDTVKNWVLLIIILFYFIKLTPSITFPLFLSLNCHILSLYLFTIS